MASIRTRGWPRRGILGLAFARAGASRAVGPGLGEAPISVAGDWRGSRPGSVLAVLTRMRGACLEGVPLVSDQQPAAIVVTDHDGGVPYIWLHYDDRPVAEVNVTVSERDWSRLAYQFGHELGHVLANSWRRDAHPGGPSQWLEEALVEAFSLRGLGRLADEWERTPPFPGDAAFGAAIRGYRDQVLARYAGYAAASGAADDTQAWFAARRAVLEASPRLTEACEAFVPALWGALADSPARTGDLGALNRWPGRSGLDVEAWLAAWETSCRETGAAGGLPGWIRAALLG